MNPPVSPSPLPPAARGSSPSRAYTIQPTPTFSFTDDPAPGPLWKPPGRRRRARGGFGRLVLLMLIAGVAGYAAVRTRAWENTGPIVNRATELARSLRTLAPSATTDQAPAAPSAGAPSSAAAPIGPSAAPAPTAAEVVRPEVVPIAPPSEAAARAASSAHRATRARRHVAARASSGDSSGASSRPGAKSLTDEEAEEEALLASPK